MTSRLFGQQLDSLGLGNDKILNRQEYIFFNSDFADKKDNFDFKGKQIAYVGGTTGNSFWTKKDYFDTFVRPRIGTNKKRNYSLTILTPTEKKESGGYDAFILTPVKVFTTQNRKRLVKELRKK